VCVRACVCVCTRARACVCVCAHVHLAYFFCAIQSMVNECSFCRSFQGLVFIVINTG
jgi:hypothetical protein